MMLRRLESIKNCGIFEDFRWKTNVPGFERINLIYGTNGAGKTSLSRALDDLAGDGEGFTKVSIRMSNADKTDEQGPVTSAICGGMLGLTELL
ncbi:AAA family ATPase [Pengzhenrongella phosphoraccumulans]|uniref:AAA family ATPase n=1 Tax=Pengzhenrongella phosphoraccumulans TaxID=3114394 RepID=UPI00388EB708